MEASFSRDKRDIFALFSEEKEDVLFAFGLVCLTIPNREGFF